MGLFDTIKKAASEAANTIKDEAVKELKETDFGNIAKGFGDAIGFGKQGQKRSEPLVLNATRDVPNIKKLVDEDKWDEALELADELNFVFRMVVYNFRRPLNLESIKMLYEICGENNIDVKFYDGNNETDNSAEATTLILLGNSKTSAKNLAPTIEKLDAKNVLPKNRDFNYDAITPNSAKADIIKKFYSDRGLINKVEKTAYDWIEKFANELGLNDDDNPFITFLSKWEGAPLDSIALHALNNLYAKNIIDPDEVRGLDENKILFNEELYEHSRERVEEIITNLKNS